MMLSIKLRSFYPKKNRNVLFFLLVILGYYALKIPSSIVIVESNSINKNIFLRVSSQPSMGDYILAKIDGEKILKEGEVKIIKKIVCQAGDRLEISDNRVFCNQEKIGTILDRDVSIFSFNGIIPEGHVFLMGDHEESFDSRYFGFINEKNILCTLSSLF